MDVFGDAFLLVIAGPRKSGKTIAAKQLISQLSDGQYVDLKNHQGYIPCYTSSCTE